MAVRRQTLAGRVSTLAAANAAATAQSLKASADADAVLEALRKRDSKSVVVEEPGEEEDDDDEITPIANEAAKDTRELSARRLSQVNWKDNATDAALSRRLSRVHAPDSPHGLALNRPRASPTSKSMSNGTEHADTVAELQAAIAKLVASNSESENAILKMLDQIETLQIEHKTLGKKVAQTTTLVEKQKQIQNKHESLYSESESNLTCKNYELDEARRNEAKANQGAKAIQIRLERALQDVARVKKDLQNERLQKGGKAVPKADYDKVVRDGKRAEKQKHELLQAYKKQAKLIEILRRQKLHLETAKDIEFSYDEFVKTIDVSTF